MGGKLPPIFFKKYEVIMHEDVILDANLDTFINVRRDCGSQEHVADILGLKNQQQISAMEVGIETINNRTYTLLMLLTDNHNTYDLFAKSENKPLLINAPNFKQIKAFREGLREGKKKVTQGRMASLMKMGGKQAISKYERGERVPSIQAWSMWLLITNKHPNYKLLNK